MRHYEVGVPPYLQPFKGEAPETQPSRPTVLGLLPAPGAAERGGPAHKASGDMGRPWRFLGTLSAAVPLAGHCGGREKSARSSAGAGEGRGRRERERMCLTTGCRAERRLRAGFL